ELGALGRLGELDVVLEIDTGVGLRIGMAPRSHVMSGRIEEGAEPHPALTFHVCSSTRARSRTRLRCGSVDWSRRMVGKRLRADKCDAPRLRGSMATRRQEHRLPSRRFQPWW